MKIAWFSTVLPDLKDELKINGSGGWITALAELFINNGEHHLDIFCLSNNSERFYSKGCVNVQIIHTSGNFYDYDKKVQKRIDEILSKTNYDILDIQGLEFSFSRYLLPYVDKLKVIATVQGFAHQIDNYYLENLKEYNLTKYRTLRNIIFKDDLLSRKNLYHRRGLQEIKILKRIHYIIGRTEWDKSVSLSINPEIKYYDIQRILRASFYNSKKWSYDKCKKYKIFLAQSHYPIKGLDTLLTAFYDVLKEYPDAEIVISGKNMGQPINWKEYLKKTDYQNIIIQRLDELKLKSRVTWLGRLNSSDMINEMLSSHLVVLPSIIENSPNTVAEAQLLGIPIVAHDTGGVSSYVENNFSGYLYENNSHKQLTEKIKHLFSSLQELNLISQNSIRVAESRHSQEKIFNDLLRAYQAIHLD